MERFIKAEKLGGGASGLNGCIDAERRRCEVYYIERSSLKCKNFAFTLAEVLITLGIIGVVVAMTIPSLIAKHKNQVTVTRLKHAYSVIGQAITSAQAEYGDIASWGLAGLNGADTSTVDWYSTLNSFAKTYFLPYIKIINDYGIISGESLGYDGPYLPSSGSQVPASKSGYWITLADGTLVMIGLGDACVEKNPDDDSCIRREYRNINFKVDINGLKKPNTNGKDVFIMALDLINNKFSMHNYSAVTSRSRYVNQCATDDGSQVCGQLIIMDGWQIKNDYPWK